MSNSLLFRTGVIAFGLVVCAMLLALSPKPPPWRIVSGVVGFALAMIGAIHAESAGKIPAHKVRPGGVAALAGAVAVAGLWVWGAVGGTSGPWFATAVVVAAPTLLVGSAIYIGSRKPPE